MSDRPGRYLRRRAEQLFRAHTGSENTQAAIAYDLANFLTFLWSHRHPLGRRGWRDAEPDDRAAYQHWRRSDENGPGVQGSTWSREVATVNCFYRWAVDRGFVERNPFLQRPVRGRPGARLCAGEQTPAEAPHDGRRDDLA